MKTLYLEDLQGKTETEIKKHLVEEYTAPKDEIKKYKIIIAYESVGRWGCDSSSFFLLQNKETEEYFEVHGSHCSCCGFEDQFSPERTTLRYLKSKRFDFSKLIGGYDNSPKSNIDAVHSFLKSL